VTEFFFFLILRTIFTPEKSSPSLLRCDNKHPPPADCIGKHGDLFSGGTLLEFQTGRPLVLQKTFVVLVSPSSQSSASRYFEPIIQFKWFQIYFSCLLNVCSLKLWFRRKINHQQIIILRLQSAIFF
jgi:hypothetical protein